MKTQIAVYAARCGASGRGCEIEELVDDSVMPYRILGPGRVLHKCSKHTDVPDAALWGVHQAEGAEIRNARLLHGDGMQYRFAGTGATRALEIL